MGWECRAGDVSATGQTSATSVWEQDTLTGDWGGERKALSDRGLTISSIYVGEVFGNPSGGVQQGAIYDGVYSLILDGNVPKLTGWTEGGNFHVNILEIHGGNPSQNVGDFGGISSISGYDGLRLNECWYDQDLWDKRVSIKAGLIAADTEFFVSDTEALFLNASFGAFPLLGVNLPASPSYPITSPGIRLLLKPSPDWYFQTAIFDGDPGTQYQNKNGLDLRFQQGVLLFSEIGYLLNADPDAKGLSSKFKLGSFVQTGPYATWDSQTANALSAAPLEDQGPAYGVYGIIDHQFYKEGQRIICGAVRGGVAPSDIEQIGADIDAGLTFSGFVPSRKDDEFGIGMTRSWVSQSYQRMEAALYGTGPATAESAVEVTYQFSLAPWWQIQPDFQYVVSPGGNPSVANAVVIGCRTSFRF